MEEGLLTSEVKSAENNSNLSAVERLKICNRCPLFIKDMEVCNPNMWMNPKTKETSRRAKAGYTKGCGCAVKRKAKQPSSHCHLGLW